MNRLQLIRADITTLDVDVVVNAANSSLLGGGGVDGAIHRAAGPELLEFCRTLGGARPGEVKLSPGFRLKAKAIAHAVGPIWNGGAQNERELLERCYRRAIRLALDAGHSSIAFPAISTGVYRFPFDEATRIALRTVRDALSEHPTLSVTLCFFSDADLSRAQELAGEWKRSLSNTMPALFIGHGNPMYALGNNRFHDGWREAATRLPKPRAVLCISAHFETRHSYVTGHEQPETIHDFYGFPRRLFDVQYPAPGSLGLARHVHELVTSRRVRVDEGRGLDHGCWSVLRALYPDADVPVAQLSLDMSAPPAMHYALGRELASLREDGVLLLGSGNLVHNLARYDFHDPAPVDWAVRADAQLWRLIEAGDHAALCEPHALGEDLRLAVPTLEHYLPLLYVLGARREGEPLETFNDVVEGTMSMRCLRLG